MSIAEQKQPETSINLRDYYEQAKRRTKLDPKTQNLLDKYDKIPPQQRAAQVEELFAEWAKEDATDDPEELKRREDEWKEFKRECNANCAPPRRMFDEE
ncbi:MAG: hypothetical protein ACR2IE_09320 [Candidatus Sumerlaeaceae bacterium]